MKMGVTRRVLCALLAMLAAAVMGPAARAESGSVPETGKELTEQMQIGWNLGNTLDAPSETAWGNPAVTAELFDTVKALGFNTVRIPVSWSGHTAAAPAYTIDSAWMDRVETVVDQALEAGLYVIVNAHHDNGIYYPAPENAERAQEYLAAVWSQIAARFADRDHRLVFQTMNEPRVEGTSYEWNVDAGSADCMAAVDVVNDLNQTALDAIRAGGGYNADRFVLVCPYAGSPGGALLSRFRMPEDSAEDRLLLSIHAYTPYDLCLDTRSPADTFTKAGRSQIEKMLESLDYMYVQKGVPVVIDEMGCIDKDDADTRYDWARYYLSAAAGYGIPCIWWDNGAIHTDGENFGLIDRRTLAVYEDSRSVYQGLMDGLNGKE